MPKIKFQKIFLISLFSMFVVAQCATASEIDTISIKPVLDDKIEGQKFSPNTLNHEASNKAASETNQIKALYVCPMHAQVTSDRPGKCHLCGMPLRKTKEDHNEESNDHSQHENH